MNEENKKLTSQEAKVMNEDEDNKLLTTEEVAKILRLPKATVLLYCHQRKINYYKIGRYNHFLQKDVKKFIKDRLIPAVGMK